jgi:integration host factor subunit beta
MARDTELAVRLILDAIGDALAEGSRVEVRGFGSFALSFRPPRLGRNPKSGDQVVVPAKHVPHFKAGKELRERVDQIAIDEAAAAAAKARTPTVNDIAMKNA